MAVREEDEHYFIAYEYVHHSTSVGERIGRRRKKQQGGRKEWEKEEGRDRERGTRREREGEG